MVYVRASPCSLSQHNGPTSGNEKKCSFIGVTQPMVSAVQPDESYHRLSG